MKGVEIIRPTDDAWFCAAKAKSNPADWKLCEPQCWNHKLERTAVARVLPEKTELIPI